MLPLQVPGGPELLIVLLIWGVMALLPIVVVLIGLYLLYKIRKDVASMSRSLQRIADTQAAPSSGTGPAGSASTG
ncbi:hypothetical protein ACFQE1_09450, partial [Halobium palmae]